MFNPSKYVQLVHGISFKLNIEGLEEGLGTSGGGQSTMEGDTDVLFIKDSKNSVYKCVSVGVGGSERCRRMRKQMRSSSVSVYVLLVTVF